jgi:hypothetical protein
MEDLSNTDVKDKRMLDVRSMAALYLFRVDHKKDEALLSLAEVIATPGRSMAKGRAWSNVFLLGSEAKGIVGKLQSLAVDQADQAILAVFRSRCE